MILNYEELILPYLTPFILIIVQGYYLNEWIKRKNKRKRKELWITFLRSNEIIDRCLNDSEKFQSFRGYPAIIVLTSFVVGYILSINLFEKYMESYGDPWLANAESGVYNLGPFLALVILNVYKIYIDKKEINLIGRSNLIFSSLYSIQLFIFSFNVMLAVYYIGSAEGHEYPALQVGDEVNPRTFFVHF